VLVLTKIRKKNTKEKGIKEKNNRRRTRKEKKKRGKKPFEHSLEMEIIAIPRAAGSSSFNNLINLGIYPASITSR